MWILKYYPFTINDKILFIYYYGAYSEMKYPKEHKEQVTKKLSHHAARQLRSGGVDRLSVKSVMGAENMTVGGFYAHFESRDELVTSAIDTAYGESLSNFYAEIEHLDDAEWLEVAVGGYLSSLHRDNVDISCPAASLLSDSARSEPDVKAVYESGLKKLIKLYERRLVGGGHENASAKAMALFAMMSGALQLSRSVNSKKYSNEMLDSCLSQARAMIS